jgi:hypothetical protein
MASIDEMNYKWFKDNLPYLIKDNKGKYLIIHEKSLKGVHPNYEEALREALKIAKPGEFLIQRCVSEEECAQVLCSLFKLPQLV